MELVINLELEYPIVDRLGLRGVARQLSLRSIGARPLWFRRLSGPWALPAAAGTRADVRAYALNLNSRQLLEGLRCWPDPDHATAVLADGSILVTGGLGSTGVLKTTEVFRKQ